jgi:hypothetical protein
MKESRRRRPPVERTEPARSVNGRRKSKSERNVGSRAGANPSGERSKVDARETGYQVINDAYRLIDEYLRQGQRMAESVWLPLTGAETDEKSEFKAPERFMRAMGDMTMAWVELMQQWTTSVQPATSQAPAGGTAPFTAGRATRGRSETATTGSSEAKPQARSLRVAVESRGRVEVSVHVADPTNLASLVPSELRPFAADAPTITTVSLDLAAPEEAPVLRIRVPDSQPSGAYNGLLVERGTERPRGTISLLVL